MDVLVQYSVEYSVALLCSSSLLLYSINAAPRRGYCSFPLTGMIEFFFWGGGGVEMINSKSFLGGKIWQVIFWGGLI